MKNYKKYDYDLKGEVQYWYNPNSHNWEVYDNLKKDWVGFNFKYKTDAQNAAYYHYKNGVYAYANGVLGNPLTRNDLATMKMVNNNENKFTKITRIDGQKMEWVGIGWIEVGIVTKLEKSLKGE